MVLALARYIAERNPGLNGFTRANLFGVGPPAPGALPHPPAGLGGAEDAVVYPMPSIR